MEYWAEGRATLRAALENVCDSVEDHLAAAIQEQTAHQHASLLGEVDRLKTVAARVDDLEKENRSLVEELSQLRKKLASQNRRSDSPTAPLVSEETTPRTTRAALAEVSANRQLDASVTKSASSVKQIDWKKEYSKVYVQKSALEERCEGLRGSANRLREARDSWTTYAQSLEIKLEKLKKAQNDSNPTRKSLDAEPRKNQGRVEEALSGGTKIGSNAESGPAVEELAYYDGNSTGSPTNKETQEGSDGAEQQPPLPTGDLVGPTAVIKEEPSSDPVVVSERIIRKRKVADDDLGMPAPPRKIKSEQSTTSSDPVIVGEVPVFCPHESIDLDEGEVGMPTPRKQPEWEQRYLLREERSGNTPPGRYDTPRITAPKETNTPAENLTVRPDRSASGEAPSPVKARWSLTSKIADLAEENVDSFSSPRPNRAGDQPTHDRLHSLLNEGSPMKSASLLSPARPGRDTTGFGHEKENIENLAPGGYLKVTHKSPAQPKHATTTPLKRSGPDKGKAAVRANRLRDRPLADLAPEDFKVNPGSNDGYRYAFDEVVRSREERAELAGCTDPNCCGRQFKAMAESELSAAGAAILSRPAEIQMMEKYLGDGEAHRLVNMTRQERQETWLKAKVQDLADRYGRHRHRFARRPSPPGYWNPDFPSTQEIEQNKEEAKRVERGVVEERWREAMRGGRWLFRDE